MINLLTEEKKGGLYPEEIVETVKEFEGMIVWKKTANGEEEIPEP